MTETVRAWLGSARPGRCKWCRRAIVWVMLDTGQPMPFDLGFSVREIVRHPKTQAQFLVLMRDDRHDCPERRAARKHDSV